MSFALFGLHPQLVSNLSDLGFFEPTPTQRLTLPSIVAGGDLLVRAQRGNGRTAALAAGLVQRLALSSAEGLRALVLAPDAARANELLELVNRLAAHQGFAFGPLGERGNGVPVVGWVVALEDFEALAGTAEEMLASVTTLVLESAERLPAGFGAALAETLVPKLPGLTQRLILASLLGPDVRALADRLLSHPAVLEIGPAPAAVPAEEVAVAASATEPAAAGPSTSEAPAAEAPAAEAPTAEPAVPVERLESVIPIREELKAALLASMIEKLPPGARTLVFSRTRFRANRLSEWLNRHGLRADRIHGDRSFKQRTEALAAFRKGALRALVTTDVNARGLEGEPMALVVHFDVPTAAEDYRTRFERIAGVDGRLVAAMFACEAEEGPLRAIERTLGRTLERIEPPADEVATFTPEALEAPEAERPAKVAKPQPPPQAPREAQAPRRDRKRKGGAGSGGGGGERQNGGGEYEDESRIRALAEAQQAAAVAARMSPSRMGIMEQRHAPRPQFGGDRSQGGGGGGGARRRPRQQQQQRRSPR